ncbi:MAG: CopG family transcriptional regulator [Candidatus Omnitrophica bacterium]|nr:CopG family transcriptional regulator [Candidatus Omnitrophota bacterium]
MKKKTINSDMPIGKLTKIRDFLPPPAQLVVPEETTKITISLKKSSVEFFRHEAERYHSKYQRMIRELLDKYAMQYARN